MTFVSGNHRVIYGGSVRYRGNWRPFNGPTGSTRCGFALEFPESARFLGDNEVKLDTPGQTGGDSAVQRERHGSWFASALGLPASNIRLVHVAFTGSASKPEDCLAISEIMHHPAIPGTGFVEIHNSSTYTRSTCPAADCRESISISPTER